MERPDLARVQRFLSERFGAEPELVTALDLGAWSSPYAFRLAGRDLVIRFSPLDEDFRKDERAARWRTADLPVPEMLTFGRAFDGFFAITAREHGGYLERLPGSDLRALLPALFRMLDAIRGVDVSGTSGYGLWGGDGEAQFGTWEEALVAVGIDRATQRIHGWSEAIKGSAAASAAFRAGYGALTAVASRLPGVRHLIHADLLNRNVLVDRGHVAAVLDWGSALYGDFLFDLAWLWFWAPWSPGWDAIDFRQQAAIHYEDSGLHVPAFEERLRTCAIYIGLDGMAYQAWKSHWSELEVTAERTWQVLKA